VVANKYSRSGQSSAPVNPVHVGEAASATPSAPHVVGKSHGRHRLSPNQPEAPFRFCFNMVLYRAPYMGKKLENVPDAA
jgi:hypothetical protein